MAKKDNIYRIDYLLIIAVVLLSAIGILMIYSSGFDLVDKVNSGLYKRQIIWFIIGFILMIGTTFLSYKQLGDYSLHIYGILMVVLLFTTIFGTPIRNTRAWLTFGSFSIQPSEFMKLSLVIILGKFLVLRERDMLYFRELFIPALITLVPVIIVLKQPDFGTAVIFLPVLMTMLFVGGADIYHLVSFISIATIALTVPMYLTYRELVGIKNVNAFSKFFTETNTLFIFSGILLILSIVLFAVNYVFAKKILRRLYIPGLIISLGLMASVIIQNFFKLYQKKRILAFLITDHDPHGSGYNIIQSKIAIGSGGFIGKGFLKGTQSQLGFLPEKSSDFIFAVIAEEWGFIGAIIVISLLAVIVFRGIQIALESSDKLGSLIASGITAIFFFHFLINIGMVIGIMPVTGLPLCFVSYGGSNMIMSMIGVGILVNIRMRKFAFS